MLMGHGDDDDDGRSPPACSVFLYEQERYEYGTSVPRYELPILVHRRTRTNTVPSWLCRGLKRRDRRGAPAARVLMRMPAGITL